MERRLSRMIESYYPFPIAIEFRRLNTPEYINYDYKRLKQILRTVEKTIHFLTLIILSDLIENYIKSPFSIKEEFKREFTRRFTRTTFGKWISLARDSVKIFKENQLEFHISELNHFFIKGKNKDTTVMNSLSQLVRIRNKLEHPDFNPTTNLFKELTHQCEQHLEIIFQEMQFIADYQFLFIHNISVNYPRWQDPKYFHIIADITGLSSEFRSVKKESQQLLNTPSLVIARENSTDYLLLEPLIIYSEEGKAKIPDIFLYMDWTQNGKNIKYLPADKGGEFNLLDAAPADTHIKNLLRFFDIFALENDYLSIKETAKRCGSINSMAEG